MKSPDLLVGGFPCQGASVAGKRLGLADDRTALFWEICRVQAPCHPLAAGQHAPLLATAFKSGGDVRLGAKPEATDALHANQTPAVERAGAVRRLTPTECERLQGFPDGWTCLCQPLETWVADPEETALRCVCPDGPRYRTLGNAVTVSVIKWLGVRLKKALDENLTSGKLPT